MTDLAKLVVRLEAETARYQKELERARKQLTRFDRDAVDTARRVAKSTAAAAAAAVAALSAMSRAQINVQDEAGKTAQRLGLTTEELTRLRFAAKLTGVEQNTLEMALQRMTRRLAEAAAGGGEAAGAIEQLGLDAERLARMSPAQAFAEISEAIQDVPAQAERVRLAFKFFDSEGVRLVNTLALGKQGLKDAGDEAERLGVVIDQNASMAAARFNDNVTRLRGVVQGFSNQLVERLLPTLEGLSAELVTASQKGDGFESSLDGAEQVLRAVTAGGIVAGSAIANLTRALAAFSAAASQIDVSATDFIFGGIPRILIKNRKVIAAQVELLQDTFTGLSANMTDAFDQAAKVMQDGFGKLERESKEGVRRTVDASGFTFGGIPDRPAANDAGMTTAEERALAGIDAYNRALEEGRRVYESTRTAAELLADEQARLNQLLTVGAIDQDTYNRALEDAQDRFQDTSTKADEWARTMEEISASAARNIQSSLADFLFDPFSDGLDGMVQNFARTIQRLLAEAAAAAVINNLFKSESGGLEGALGGFLSSAFGGARATGGPVSTGKAYLVGENGPELMVPGTAGHIVSNEVLNQQAVNQTIVVNAPSGSVSRATELQIQAAAGRGVAAAMRRNG